MEFESQNISSVLLTIAQRFLQTFSTLDSTSISSIQSDSFKHEFAPTSADPPAPLNQKTFASHLTSLRDVMRSFPMRARHIWPNPSLSQVTIWADNETDFHPQFRDNDDQEEWTYQGQSMFVLTMDSKAQKIEHVLEFVDSKGMDKLRNLLARAQQRKRELEPRQNGH